VLAEVRVDTLRETHSLVIHVENTVIILKEVNAKVSLASVASRRDLQHTVPVPIDHVLMLAYHVVCLLDCEGEVGHRIVLLHRAVGTPQANWVQLGLASTILFVHDA